MFTSLGRSLLVAGTIAATTLGLSAATASASEARITITTSPMAGIELAQYHDRGDRWDRRGDRDDRRYDRGSCSAGQALRKASRFGLRRPEIVRDNRRAVVVDGWKRGRLVSVRFAQERGCPVLNVR
ncbi:MULTISPECIES: hypothetical protein [unclassified Aureimonas]|uniref:hypothetical protein n=1 Tax=unclassified Aureimonas TaxID=2615206 RepID=UPI0006F8C540|nr:MULTISPECIES: hypothetical protein [unclassified Aureimonas]KQT69601.1 hypothetical protein ASG62_00190 [Aureimonas sp. Leaf427]KQT80952.1 hypothetical protein ASG54_05720 [Aureimonas sp. Leaf460]